MSALLPLLSLFACGSKDPVAKPDTQDTGAETPPPEVWGVAAAEDHDPDPDVVEVHLAAAPTSVDGWDEDGPTEVWAYNGQVPGPLIQLWEGQELRVLFENQLPEDETTIHWHGLRIDDEMDGVPMLQDPVAPGETFTYTFSPPDTGSYWYHPHITTNEQVERGLQGPLIIHEADSPQADRERFFVIDDVYLRGDGQIVGFSGDHMTDMHGRYGNNLLVNGSTDLLTDETRPLGVERWRVVNTANAREMWVAVTGASWRVIAVDGTLLPEPYTTERADLPPGRRVDLEVIPDADATTVTMSVELPEGVASWESYPVFEATVTGEPGAGEPLDWGAEPLPVPEETTQEVTLNLNAESDEDGDLIWVVNGQVYGDHEAILVEGNTPTRLVVRDRSGLDHPFHLHGQFFQVISREGEVDPEDVGLLDTVMVGGYEELELYTTFDNPGTWMAHCHILEHAELGMMAELVVSEATTGE